MRNQVIHIEPLAPPKPAVGDRCNGCGVCCLAEPCPVGVVMSLRRTGPCTMLVWDATAMRYVCGVVARRPQVKGQLPNFMEALRRKLVLRWISAGSGCDSTLAPSNEHPRNL